MKHLSDQDLIMAADGELAPQRLAEVEAHLAACWSCRERADALERTIGEFVRERKLELDREITPGAGRQALLRARLAENAQAGGAGLWRYAFRRTAPVALAFLCGLVVIAVLFEKNVSAEGPRPKAGLTPGETRQVTMAEVCRSPRAEVVAADIPEDVRRRVFSEYGIDGQANNFEVDYLITPDLGGAFSIRNLWPQPYSTRWNAHVKDQLEQRLHELVCEGKVDLPTAQHEIAADWIGAYKKYFHTNQPPAAE